MNNILFQPETDYQSLAGEQTLKSKQRWTKNIFYRL